MQNIYPHPSLIYQLFSFICPPLSAGNVFIFKGNLALTRKTLDLQEITLSNFDRIQLKITLYYYHREQKSAGDLQNNDYLPRYNCFYEHWS